ncbi:PD-(D/E)XK motif protein [Mesorhizobium sp. M4B.F.Ca.ET.169.01.1.1]|uniref:PD-(D/E)XK motif protein n=1 Tax=unclassified Mesorhizobium TaxID=325217 RepID=UPI000FC9F046|nr:MULTISPECIES: PD-(D/E)XK motif protein [unclassified Mesorhizobium]RVD46258.1 PD-(D/E)XK motif protein [Mesorhizobium sp. M4B.F.Ca.ET.019.03.1.1]TGT41944.1 PD-(D/E)XK motif protein [Mesorhizobium sp. M4B.F.Ca.ET.169.01.1.1]
MTSVPEPATLLLPSWEVLRRDYIEPGLPGRVVVRDHPKLELFVDPGGLRFGATLALPSGSIVSPSPLTDIEIVEIRADGTRCVEISTRAAGLFGTFYLLVVDVARAVLERSVPPIAALEVSLAHWRALLQTSALLSDEKQLGLVGELWLLGRLLRSFGTAGLDSWLGPNNQSHDFRIGDIEFEVKATSGTRRVHIINGLQQLAPTAGARLYLLSLRFVDAGAGGETLGEMVQRIAAAMAPGDLPNFEDKLVAVGFRAADAVHYSRRRRIADRARLIPIEDGVPRLTAEALSELPARFAPAGISDITYRIDIEGLGLEEGTTEFAAVVPSG